MIALASRAALIRSIERARNVTFVAYVLPHGAVFKALLEAARRGARVCVRLEGRPYYDRGGGVRRFNEATAATLRAEGADARLVDEDGTRPLHAKAAIVDGTLFLDDVNFGAPSKGTLVRDSSARDAAAMRAALAARGTADSRRFSAHKAGALALEAALLHRAGDGTIVETESAGRGNRVWSALARLGRKGLAPRLLVARSALGVKERTNLEHLIRDGVRVRACSSTEKFAAYEDRVWIGSANATSAFGSRDGVDWGARTRDAAIAAHVRARFDARWQNATPLTA